MPRRITPYAISLAGLLAHLPGCSEPVEPIVYGEVQVSDVDWQLHDEIFTLLYVSWQQQQAATGYVEYSFDEGEWLASPAQELQAGDAEALLLGIPYNTQVTFRVVNDFGEGPLTSEEMQANTGLQPGGLPTSTLVSQQADRWDPSRQWLLGSINQAEGDWDPGDYWRFILDRQGRYVWAQLTPDQHWSIYVQVSQDGDDILWDESDYWSDLELGPGGQVHRTKIDGTVVWSYPTPQLQHAFVELPDESIVWGASFGIEDQLKQVTVDGDEEVLFSCAAYLASIGSDEYCLHNGLYYDELRDTFLFSLYSIDSVLEVDRSTGEVVHAFGHVPGAWGFDPADSAFWTQHGPTYTDLGTLLVSTHRSDDDEEGVVREYTLDEDEALLQEIWSFGQDEGIHMESAGEAHRLPGGNTLHNMGSGARVREITPEGDVVWDVAWESPRLLGRTLMVDDLYAFAP